MAVSAKFYKAAAVVALSLAMVGCGKATIKFTGKTGATTSVQTVNGTLQVSKVSNTFIGDRTSTTYQISFVLTQGGRTIELNTYPTPDQNSYDSKNFGNDYYAVRTVCATSNCETFAALFNYGSYQGSGIQFAVLYQGKADGSGNVIKMNEELNTNYNSVSDALNSLVSAM